MSRPTWFDWSVYAISGRGHWDMQTLEEHKGQCPTKCLSNKLTFYSVSLKVKYRILPCGSLTLQPVTWTLEVYIQAHLTAILEPQIALITRDTLLLYKADYGEPATAGIDTRTISTLSTHTHTYQEERLTADFHMISYKQVWMRLYLIRLIS
jgi:hypothetical protein